MIVVEAKVEILIPLLKTKMVMAILPEAVEILKLRSSSLPSLPIGFVSPRRIVLYGGLTTLVVSR